MPHPTAPNPLPLTLTQIKGGIALAAPPAGAPRRQRLLEVLGCLGVAAVHALACRQADSGEAGRQA